MKDFESCDKGDKDSVIWEDEVEFKKQNKTNMFDGNEEDPVEFVKSGTQIYSKVTTKIRKNQFFVLSLLLITLVYYIVTFESIMPMYEAELTNRFDISNKITKNNKGLNTSFGNRGVMYLYIFNFVVVMFLFSFLRTALMDPGKYSKEYIELYSLTKYHEMYNNYYLNMIFTKRKKSSEISTNNSILEFPNMNLKSSLLLKKNADKK